MSFYKTPKYQFVLRFSGPKYRFCISRFSACTPISQVNTLWIMSSRFNVVSKNWLVGMVCCVVPLGLDGMGSGVTVERCLKRKSPRLTVVTGNPHPGDFSVVQGRPSTRLSCIPGAPGCLSETVNIKNVTSRFLPFPDTSNHR